MVISGRAKGSILDTYEPERRAVGEINCDWGLFTFNNSAVINTVMGLLPGKKEHNKIQFELLLEDSDRGSTFRAQVARIIESQSVEFCTHGIELGFRYNKGLFLPDGSVPPKRDPLGLQYFPTTKPGHRLPHAWIEKSRGQIISTHHIVSHSLAFALITDAEGSIWVSAAERIAACIGNNALIVAQIGDHCPYRDYEDSWAQLKGVQPGGSILVRPDNIVAWRSIYPSKRDGKELEEAVDILLGCLREDSEHSQDASRPKL